MPNKRSRAELKRLVANAFGRVCGLPRTGFWLNIDEMEFAGRPPSLIRVWATLHFLTDGSPYCCGEPTCHLGISDNRLAEIGDEIRRSMNLTQAVNVELAALVPKYAEGVAFHHGHE